MIQVTVSALLSRPPRGRDYRALMKANCEKTYVLVTGEWYPAQMSHACFLDDSEPHIAAHYPELLPADACPSEIQLGSPMSQADSVTKGESFLTGDSEISPAANADVSMSDRSMVDVLA